MLVEHKKQEKSKVSQEFCSVRENTVFNLILWNYKMQIETKRINLASKGRVQKTCQPLSAQVSDLSQTQN